MKTYTFETILDQVVNNRTLSRKEKDVAIQKFLRANTGKGKQPLPEEITIIETLKNLRKNFVEKDKNENKKVESNKFSY